LLPIYGPAVDHHFAERIPGHAHVYLGEVLPDHTHPYEAEHDHAHTDTAKGDGIVFLNEHEANDGGMTSLMLHPAPLLPILGGVPPLEFGIATASQFYTNADLPVPKQPPRF
jgi:hypothetical protein